MIGPSTSGALVPANVSFGMFGVGSATAGIIDRKIDLYLEYRNWIGGSIPTIDVATAVSVGDADCMWTIQPSGGPCGAPASACVNWPSLIAGQYDAEIVAFADWINTSWRRPLYVRFAHEANSTGWYDWQVGGSCGVASATQWVAGFNRFAAVLKANSEWPRVVWAVNCGPYDNIVDFYPSECDIMGLDGYNGLGSWQTDSEVFGPAYAEVDALDLDKPIWICEMACTEPSLPWTYDGVTCPVQPQYSKANWITTFMANTAYPRLQAWVWFNVEKERNWIVNSSAGSTRAFVQAFTNTGNIAK